MGRPYDLVSNDAARALEEFSLDFFAALTVAEVDPWATTLGLYRESRAIRTMYPVPISAAGYAELKGDIKYRELFERSISMKPRTWQEGVKSLASVIEAPDFTGWGDEPMRIAREAARLPNSLVAAMLEANPYADIYTQRLDSGDVASTVNMFSATHLINIVKPSVGTFSNLVASGTYTAIDATFVKAMKQHFRGIKGPNGKPLGLKMTHLLVPSAREEEAADFFQRDTLVETIQNAAGTDNVAAVANRNRHAGTVTVVVSDELTDDDVVYPMALGTGCYPWIVQSGGAPEEIRSDRDSELYKRSLHVGVAYVLEASVAPALPHGIVSVDLG